MKKQLDSLEEYYEELEQETRLKKLCFYTGLRSHLFNKVTRKSGGVQQWKHILGVCNRHRNGEIISLSKSVERELWKLVEYYNSEEGLDVIRELGIDPPDHPDDIKAWVQNSKTARELNSIIFKYVLKKYRYKPF